MERLVVEGGRPLEGTLRVSGAKNAALPLLAAALLTNERCVLRNVPALDDVHTLLEILSHVGLRAERRGPATFALEVEDERSCEAPYELVARMRASIYLLGPLLAKRGHARVALPGGCVIGLRPVDLHIKGLRALGAEVSLEHGTIVARAPGGRLRGASMFLAGPAGSSVGATANVLMAACLAEGETVIEGAACEPEVTELVRLLQAMGARIEGGGSSRLVIEGVEALRGAEQTVVPDRIEAGSYIMAAALAGGDVRIEEARLEHLGAVEEALRQAGVALEETDGAVRVRRDGPLRAVEVTTLPYPGFPTDLQAPLVALLTQAEGVSVVRDTIYPDRFMHLAELSRMGADCSKQGGTAVIRGATPLQGAEVEATDLRAGAALVIAGLVARGQTAVRGLHHIDRGYEDIAAKLRGLGAAIFRETPSQTVRRAA